MVQTVRWKPQPLVSGMVHLGVERLKALRQLPKRPFLAQRTVRRLPGNQPRMILERMVRISEYAQLPVPRL